MRTKLSAVVGGIANAFAMKTLSVASFNVAATTVMVQSQQIRTVKTYRATSMP